MILIGLTGGIACGKSAVSRLLSEEHHIEIIDADLIVRELQGPHAPCTRQIAARWPHCVDPVTGELNRPELGKVVFSDPKARQELGKIMNPAIFRAIVQRIFCAWWHDVKQVFCSSPSSSARKPSIVVLDAPTLFETRTFTHFVSSTVVVSCSEERQIARLRSRNNLSREEALQRIHSQMPLAEKRRRAGYVVENDHVDDLDALGGAVRECVGWMAQQSNARLSCMVGVVAAGGIGVIAGVCWLGVRFLC